MPFSAHAAVTLSAHSADRSMAACVQARGQFLVDSLLAMGSQIKTQVTCTANSPHQAK